MVVEVVSPNDRFVRVESKAIAWLDAGCKLVLLLDPETETVHAYRSRSRIEIFQKGETLDCSDAIVGWIVAVKDLF
jgi:Uma2 family endonuclease